MNATTLIKPCGIGNFECLQLDGDKQELFVGDSERVAEAAEISSLKSPMLLYHLLVRN